MKEDIKDKLWEVNFTNFVNGLGLECLVALGKIENPLTKKKEPNFKQVRYIVDTLDMVKEKTRGNLTSDEEKFLDELLVYLKMLYVEVQGKAQDKTQEAAKQNATDKKQVETHQPADKTQESAEQSKTEEEKKDG